MKKLLTILLSLVLVLGTMAFVSAETPAYEKTNIVFSFFGAEGTPSGRGVTRFKELVEERSGGAVTVQTYYNGTLYNQSTEYEALMKGDVDMIVTSLNYAMEYITELKTTFCPYMWVSIEHVRDFWEKDEVGVGLMQRLENELGVRQLSWHEGGYRNICLNKDIKVDSTEALAGVKLRSSPAENMIAMTAALGGNPIPIPFSDCYLGIQTGVADGLEVDLTGLIANGLAEVTKSVTISQHYLSLDGFAVSYNNFQKWSPEVQQLVTECAKECADYICELSIQTEMDAVETLKGLGVTIYDLTDEERAVYREQVLDAFISSDFASTYDMELFDAIRNMGENY
jgi:TRAP-type C4-dicarboxylate transport system substrate-binding protein